jgi:hypothetical protein
MIKAKRAAESILAALGIALGLIPIGVLATRLVQWALR